jgi:DNA polymerase III sliding clamp (beta) subunit (PCNA family)
MKTKTLKSIHRILKQSGRGVLPILDNFMITPTDVIFTDLQTYVKVNHHYPVKESMIINASQFVRTIERIPAPFTITVNGEKIFFAGKTRQTKLSGESVGDYPMLPEAKPDVACITTITSDDIEIMKSCLKYTSGNDLRPIMAAICLESDVIVASDAHKLAYIPTSVVRLPESRLLFTREVIQLMTLSETESFTISDIGSHLMAASSTMTIWWRKIDGSYPMWRKVIPEESKHITLPLKETMNALNSILPTINDCSNLVKFDIKGDVINLTTQNCDDDSSSQETINIINDDHIELKIGFRHDFVMTILNDLLKTGYFQVSIGFGDASRSAIFENRYLLMPMMLNE